MAKIPLEFSSDKTRLHVVATINCEGKVPFPIRFVVDTGSQNTSVDETSASRVRIFTKNLELDAKNPYSLLAGTKVGYYVLGNATITFIDSNGEKKDVPFNKLKVIGNARPGSKSTYLPILLLGMDFFIESESKLVVDPVKDSAYIELE